MKNITPFLWFDNQAEEAVDLYVSIFPSSKKGIVARYGEHGPGEKGSVMTISFQLQGQDFVALNGGPHFTFSPAISFVVNCETQAEIDRVWEKLSDGGTIEQCGWLKDKFGVSWQIVPAELGRMVADEDRSRGERVMNEVMQMTKLEIEPLRRAYEGR